MLAAALFAIALLLSPSAVFCQKPNIVIFYADDLGWGDIRVHNKNPVNLRLTPEIDKIFNQGVEFANFVTHKVCSPSRAGILTGRHYAEIAAGPRTGGELPYQGVYNLGRDFQENGYRTGIFGKWHNSEPNKPEKSALVNSRSDAVPDNDVFEYTADRHFGIGVNEYGFHSAAVYYGGGTDMFNRYFDQLDQNNWWINKEYAGTTKGYTTHLITDATLQFLEENKLGPFMAFVSQQAVHNPTHLVLDELKIFTNRLQSELGISGKWDAIRSYTSPVSGKKIEDVQELRCHDGEEFDLMKMNPEQQQIIFGAYIHSLDISVGKIIQKVKDVGQFNNTIFLFASDNGGLPSPRGVNLPHQGGKHTLWEGGVHVPAAVWWPGTFDANTAPYSNGKSKFEGYITYMDIYPTLFAMSGNTFHAGKVDGMDVWNHLKTNTEPRPGFEKPVYEMWRNYGSIRTREWKLIYSESANRTELYNVKSDLAESKNVASAHPDITSALRTLYRNWITENKYAVPFLPLQPENLTHAGPTPNGQILEIKAQQNGNSNDGLYIRFALGDWTNNKLGEYIEPGDRVQFDIKVAEDSEKDARFFYSPAEGWNHIITNDNGLDHNGNKVAIMKYQKGVWTRHIVGVGTTSPGDGPINYIVLKDSGPGYYHFYVDNVVVRKKDGSVRSVIWESGDDTTPIIYRYKGTNYNSWESVSAISNFPFNSVSIKAIDSGIPTVANDKMIRPNPLAGYRQVSVRNFQGEQIRKMSISGKMEATALLESLPTGVYLFQFTGQGVQPYTIRVSQSRTGGWIRD